MTKAIQASLCTLFQTFVALPKAPLSGLRLISGHVEAQAREQGEQAFYHDPNGMSDASRVTKDVDQPGLNLAVAELEITCLLCTEKSVFDFGEGEECL